MKKKNNKGFTLIELLAVIIILGVLMLIAIPSVTTYINNSKKESYIYTVKELINSTSHKVNSGELDIFDPSVTYYIPTECIAVENAKTSPYGDLKDSYVVVTYNNDGFDYYYTGTDTANMGIYLTYRELIDIKSINSSVNKIEPNISIGSSSSIIVFDCNGNKTEVEPVMSVDPEMMFTDDLIEEYNEINSGNTSSYDTTLERPGYMWNSLLEFGTDIYDAKAKVEKISVVKTSTFPTNAVKIWDVTEEKNGNAKAWLLDEDNDGLYELYVGSKRKIVANSYSYGLFAYFLNATTIDVSNLDTSKVTNMSHMFSGLGTDSDKDMNVTKIIGLEKLDTSNVTDMSSMFFCTSNLTELNLSNFDTSKVENMRDMFSGWFHGNGALKVLDLSNFDLSSLKNASAMFMFDSQLTTIKIGKNKATKLETAEDMFYYNSRLINLDISNLKIDSSVNTTDMFDITGPYSNSSNFKITVDSATTMDYIISDRDNNGLRSNFDSSNFIIK